MKTNTRKWFYASLMVLLIPCWGDSQVSYLRPRSGGASDTNETDKSNVVFYDNFQRDDLGWWTPINGDWSVHDEKLYVTDIKHYTFITIGDSAWQNYILELKAMETEGESGLYIGFRIKNNKSFLTWTLGGWGNAKTAIESWMDWSPHSTIIGKPTPNHIEFGKWYDIKIIVHGSHVKCYLDNKLMQEYQGPELETISSGKIGLGTNNTKACFSDVKVTLLNKIF